MRTINVVNSGIDRNFLRQCEKRGLITPKRIDNDCIFCKEYQPREYTNEEVEIVWYAYLCRKMGLSYKQIDDLVLGKKIRIRDSLNDLIKKYEKQIEELQALIKFMKIAKGVGFVPSLFETTIGAESFKDYLDDFLQHLDKDNKTSKAVEIISVVADIHDTSAIDNRMLNELGACASQITPNMSEQDSREYAVLFIKLKNKIESDPATRDVQCIVEKIYQYQKKIMSNDSLSVFEFCFDYISAFSYDSDISAVYKNLFGEDTIKYLCKALEEFLKIKEPKRANELLSLLK